MNVCFVGDFEYFNNLEIYELNNGDRTNLGVFRRVQNASLKGILNDKFAVEFVVYDINAHGLHTYIKMKETAKKMEAFPSNECIEMVDGIMLVKLDN